MNLQNSIEIRKIQLCGAIREIVAQLINLILEAFVSGRVGHKMIQSIGDGVSSCIRSCYNSKFAFCEKKMIKLFDSWFHAGNTLTIANDLVNGWLQAAADIVLIELIWLMIDMKIPLEVIIWKKKIGHTRWWNKSLEREPSFILRIVRSCAYWRNFLISGIHSGWDRIIAPNQGTWDKKVAYLQGLGSQSLQELETS